MRNGSVVCLTILLGITLCSGLLVKAGQMSGKNHVVDPPMEQAQQIYIHHVSDEELARRRANWKPRVPKITTGYLARYAALVTSGNRGAILDIPRF